MGVLRTPANVTRRDYKTQQDACIYVRVCYNMRTWVTRQNATGDERSPSAVHLSEACLPVPDIGSALVLGIVGIFTAAAPSYTRPSALLVGIMWKRFSLDSGHPLRTAAANNSEIGWMPSCLYQLFARFGSTDARFAGTTSAAYVDT